MQPQERPLTREALVRLHRAEMPAGAHAGALAAPESPPTG
jgi:hypothetical protein